MAAHLAYRGWPAACVLVAAVVVATGARAATGDVSTSERLWTAMDNVGALYAVMGQQLVDNLKSNYIELAGGDPDSVNVPHAIIQDGFLDEEPVDENTLTSQDEQPEGAGVDETAAPTGQAGTGIATAQPDPETAESEAAEPEAPQPETEIADTQNQLGVGFEAGGGGGDGSADQGNFGADFTLVDSNLNAAQSGITAGGNLALTTGGDTTLTGAVIQGGTVDAAIGGDLTVTTVQEDEFSLALNLGAGGSSDGAGSGNFGAGIDLTDRTETTTVAGITATNGDANVTVAGDTTLTGASITAQGGEATLDTQSLTVTDLASSSLSLSAGIGGGIDASSIDGEDTEALAVLGAAQNAGDSASGANFELGSSSGTTTGGVGDGATTAVSEDAPSASEAASAVLSSLQQQIAAASETGGSGAPQGVSAEVLTEKLGTLQASASTTAFEAQQAAADVFNDGDPASAEALQGLSPNQAVLMLQAARVWLTPDQQADIDIAIQQIVTGTEPATSAGAGDS